MDKKITKRDNFNTLRDLVMNFVDLQTEQDRLLAFIDHEVEQLDKRAASAKKYAKKTAKSEDALADAVFNILSDGAQHDIPSIVAELNAGDMDATPQKVTYRLTKMVEAGNVLRETVSVKEDGKAARKVCMFTAAPIEADSDADEQ